jgi:aminoglycoside 3-N-acetyltransferase
MAKELTQNLPLDFPMGDDSFLGRLYDTDGQVLLLGADFRCATSLHQAEYRARYPGRKIIKCGAPMIVDGKRRWVEYDDIESDDSDFEMIGASYIESAQNHRSGRVGIGEALLISHRSLVDFATRWMGENRKSKAPDSI